MDGSHAIILCNAGVFFKIRCSEDAKGFWFLNVTEFHSLQKYNILFIYIFHACDAHGVPTGVKKSPASAFTSFLQ